VKIAALRKGLANLACNWADCDSQREKKIKKHFLLMPAILAAQQPPFASQKRQYIMKKTISIKELNDLESKKILKDEKFSKLKPVSCTQCGKVTGFRRKLFQIKGVPESKQSDDDVQNIIRYHLKRDYSIDFAFFKPYRNKYIVDTAFCRSCESTAITYDIDFDSDIFSELSKFTGKSESLLLKDLNRISKKLNNT
jgi:hypothetical protein